MRPAPPTDVLTLITDTVKVAMRLEEGDVPSLLMVNSWEMDATRRTVLCFRPGESTPSLVAKVGWREGLKVLRGEHENLERLRDTGSEALLATVPHLVSYEERAETGLLVETALSGEPLARLLPEWGASRAARLGADWVLEFNQAFSDLYLLDDDLLDVSVRGPLRAYRDAFELSETESRLFEASLADADALVGTRMPLPPLHGDLCAANILASNAGLRVIDWEAPLECGVPGADLFHLLASNAHDLLGSEDLEGWVSAFFRADETTKAVLRRHAERLELEPTTWRLMFVAYWADYAVEKARMVEAASSADAAPGHAALGDQAWGLVELADGSCRNLRYLADHLDDWVLT